MDRDSKPSIVDDKPYFDASDDRPPNVHLLSLREIVGLVVLIILLWFVAPEWAVLSRTWVYPAMENELSGQIGDSFGGINALFSGFAMFGVLYAVYLQYQEIRVLKFEVARNGRLTAETVDHYRTIQEVDTIERIKDEFRRGLKEIDLAAIRCLDQLRKSRDRVSFLIDHEDEKTSEKLKDEWAHNTNDCGYYRHAVRSYLNSALDKKRSRNASFRHEGFMALERLDFFLPLEQKQWLARELVLGRDDALKDSLLLWKERKKILEEWLIHQNTEAYFSEHGDDFDI